MRKAEIDALLRAHKGRARPVAFFHVLRQPTLEADDHAFLRQHVGELGATDLLRWRARCDKESTSTILGQFVLMAQSSPAMFRQEVLDAPGLAFDDSEWDQLIELTKNGVPDDLRRRIVARGLELDDEPAASALQNPLFEAPAEGEGMVDLGSFFDDLDDGEGSFPALDEPAAGALGDLGEGHGGAAVRTEEDKLEELAQLGVSRTALLETALHDMRLDPIRITGFLARQLTTPAAWSKFGSEIVGPLVAQRAFTELSELFTQAYSHAKDAPAGKKPISEERAQKLIDAMHGALSRALAFEATAALSAGDAQRALALLSGVVCLVPSTRLVRDLRALSRAEGAGEEIAHLTTLSDRRVKQRSARPASLEDLISAIHALADANM